MRVGGRQLGHIRGFEFHYFARHYFALGLPAPIAQLYQAGDRGAGNDEQADAPNRCPALQFRECKVVRTLDSQPEPVSGSGR